MAIRPRRAVRIVRFQVEQLDDGNCRAVVGLERLRSHPRFQRLLVEIGLPIVNLVGERENLERRLGIIT